MHEKKTELWVTLVVAGAELVLTGLALWLGLFDDNPIASQTWLGVCSLAAGVVLGYQGVRTTKKWKELSVHGQIAAANPVTTVHAIMPGDEKT